MSLSYLRAASTTTEAFPSQPQHHFSSFSSSSKVCSCCWCLNELLTEEQQTALMAVCLTAKRLPSASLPKLTNEVTDERYPRSRDAALSFVEASIPRGRRDLLLSSASLVAVLGMNSGLEPLMIARAADESRNSKDSNKADDSNGILSSITSLLDPNEKTKSGKVLPKAYLKSAREVVKTLRESLKEDSKNNAKFRQTADAAKESIREYLGSWSGQQTVASEESYVELEKAIRALAGFYSKAGPSAALPEDIRAEILSDLSVAEQFL